MSMKALAFNVSKPLLAVVLVVVLFAYLAMQLVNNKLLIGRWWP
jgi:hypothetical protein